MGWQDAPIIEATGRNKWEDAPLVEEAPPPPPAAEEPGFVSRVATDVGKRVGNIATAFTEPIQSMTQPEKEAGYIEAIPQRLLRAGGQAVAGVGDIAGEAAKGLYRTVTPEPVQRGLAKAGTSILDTEAGRMGLRALQAGGEAYNRFREAYPELAKDVEAVANVATMYPAVKMGAQVVGKVAAYPFKKVGAAIPPISKKAVEKRVGEILVAQTDQGPMYAKNVAEATRLEQKFPGLKFTLAAKTGQPEAIITEQGLTATGAGAKAKAVREVETGQAIRERLGKTFAGEEGIEDVLGAARKAEREVVRGREVADISSERAAKALAEGRMVPEEAGATLYERLAGEGGVKATAKEVVREKFGAVNPKVKVQTQPMQSILDDIGKQKFGAKPEDYPNEIMDFIEERIQSAPKQVIGYDEMGRGPIAKLVPQPPRPITFGDTIEIRSQIADAIRAEKAKGPLSNDTKLKRLHQLMDGVTETQRTLKNTSPKDFAAYTEAMKHYKTEYVPKIKQGATAKILSWKRTGDKAVDDAMLAGEYFKPGAQGIRAAQDFKKTFGTDEVATNALKDYAIQDMLHAVRNEATGEISTPAMQSWIHKNRPAISAHGLWDEFRDFRKTRQALEKAQEAEAVFNKGNVVKLLGVDPEKAIENVFTGVGKKDSARAAMEIMNTVKNNPAAIKGLQNSVGNYIIKKVESATKDIAKNPLLLEKRTSDIIRDLDPALRIIYRKNPSKLTALKETRDVLDTLKLSAKNIPGGSQTAQRAYTLDALNRAATGVLGWKVMAWAKPLADYVKGLSATEIEKVLLHAHFNPEFADTLKLAATKKIPVNEFRKRAYAATMLGTYEAAQSLSSLSDKELIEAIRRSK